MHMEHQEDVTGSPAALQFITGQKYSSFSSAETLQASGAIYWCSWAACGGTTLVQCVTTLVQSVTTLVLSVTTLVQSVTTLCWWDLSSWEVFAAPPGLWPGLEGGEPFRVFMMQHKTTTCGISTGINHLAFGYICLWWFYFFYYYYY